MLRDLDGGERVVVARGHNPAWSPDGSSLAFERDGAVWIVSPVGSAERRVAAGHRPSWSPDGAALVVSDHGTLRIIRLQDGQTRALGAGESPNWSSRGVIAFERNGDIYVIDSTGSALRRLTSGRASDTGPSWSSDGARLAFIRDGAVVARTPEPGAARALPRGPARRGHRSGLVARRSLCRLRERRPALCRATRSERGGVPARAVASSTTHPCRSLVRDARVAAPPRHRREPGARLRAGAPLLDSRLRRRTAVHLRGGADRAGKEASEFPRRRDLRPDERDAAMGGRHLARRPPEREPPGSSEAGARLLPKASASGVGVQPGIDGAASERHGRGALPRPLLGCGRCLRTAP